MSTHPFSNYLSHLLSEHRNTPPGPTQNLKEISTGVLEFVGENTTEAPWVISCGLHGNETAPIEIVNRIVQEIYAGKLVPKMNLLIVFGNIPAMIEHLRLIKDNLNRQFRSDNKGESEEQRRGIELMKFVQEFSKRQGKLEGHLDLHTSLRPSIYPRFAILPLSNERPVLNQKMDSLMRMMGIEAYVQHMSSSNTFTGWSSEVLDIPSVTLELGKAERFGENDLEAFENVYMALRNLLENKDQENQEHRPKAFKVIQELIKAEDYELLVPDDDLNFNEFPAGFVLERYRGGETVFDFPTRVIFPYAKVPIGQRTGMVLQEIHLTDLFNS